MLKTIVLASILGGAAAGPPDQVLQSDSLSHQLTAALTAQGLDAIATQDPDEPDRFVAALSIPGAQLLVVSARHVAPDMLRTRLAHQQYRDVYLDLQGSSVPESIWFLQDMSGDGLCRGREQAADILYDGQSAPAVFDGDWKAHGLTERDYRVRFERTEANYSRLLQLLLAQTQDR
jgi:hypothetical protein